MMNILTFLVAAALCVGVSLGAPSTTPPDTCAILDSGWKLWDLKTQTYNVKDTYGMVEANFCKDLERECAHTTNEPCNVCQLLDQDTPTAHSYCIGYSANVNYTRLNTNSFLATFKGDDCGGLGARKTLVTVFCSATENTLKFKTEDPTCTYIFELYQTQSCIWSSATSLSFQPTFSVPSITATSLEVRIDDGYPYQYWTFTVNVKKTGGSDIIAYQGDGRNNWVTGLEPETQYTVTVTRNSGANALFPGVSFTSKTLQITTLSLIAPTPTPTPATTLTYSEKGAGIAIGMVIAGVIVGAIFGIYKFTQTSFFAEKFGGGGGRAKGFSLMDAEKSSAFE